MAETEAGVTLRPWAPGDIGRLPEIANDRRIWRNLTNRFPSPYTEADAAVWVRVANGDPDNARHLAIVCAGEVVGGVGFERQTDLGKRTAEIGYWLGVPYWGRGIATRALAAATTLAFADYDFLRLQAGVLAWNPASCRVLEKAGYTFEGRLRHHVWKDGEVCDHLVYARLRDAAAP